MLKTSLQTALAGLASLTVIPVTAFPVLLATLAWYGICAAGEPAYLIFHVSDTFLSIFEPRHPSRHVGLRVVEDEPVTTPQPLAGYSIQPRRGKNFAAPELPVRAYPKPAASLNRYAGDWKTVYQDSLTSFMLGEDGTALFRYRDTAHQAVRVSLFQPVGDGFSCWMWLEAEREVPGAFIVQQCLRFTGKDNEDWRHSMALAPELSEFDLWDSGRLQSLTFVCRADSLAAVEPLREFAGQSRFTTVNDFLRSNILEHGTGLRATYYTAAGLGLAEKGSPVAPADFRIPHGLIVRESADRKLVSGMYWERTAMVSDHHPADCLHSYADLGPARPGRINIVNGKIYLFEGSKEDLLRHWKRDFPLSGTD